MTAQNVAIRETGTAPAMQPASEATALIHMIERAARDPSVDLDKMQRLMEMHDKIMAQRAEHAFNAAMAAAQAEMEPVRKDADNPQTRSKYASYDALDRAIRPIYTKHGFALSFDTEDSDKPEYVRVVCHVTHTGTERSHTRKYRRDMPADGKGAKGGDVMTKTHAAGSAETYGKRYMLQGIFNIATTNRDDDGNRASAPSGPITEAQADELKVLATDVGADVPKFCRYMKVERIEDIPASQLQRARQALEAKRGAK